MRLFKTPKLFVEPTSKEFVKLMKWAMNIYKQVHNEELKTNEEPQVNETKKYI